MRKIIKHRHISFFLTVLYIIPLFSIISCKSSPKKEILNLPEPEWITDKKGVFPDSEYLAQLGTGISATDAKNNSIAQLAAYFNTNVKSLIEGDNLTYNKASGESGIERTIKSSVVTYTDLSLFALENTEPYYLIREQKWYCCAYINRKTAWNQYEPVVRDNKNKFYSVFSLAEAASDPLEKIKIYSQAQYASEDFTASLYRASMFSKTLTDQAFAQDRAVVASIPGFIQKEKNRCVLYLATPVDSGAIVASAVNEIFSGLGFTISDNKKNAIYIVETLVNYNSLDDDELLVYYPSVKVTVKSTEKTLYVYENKLDRVMSYNKTKAESMVCDGIAELLKNDFVVDFKSTIGLSE